MNKNIKDAQTNVWDMWNHLDTQDAMIKNVALSHCYAATKKQRADTKRMLELLQQKYESNLELLEGIIECWSTDDR
jgi:hypothetical protein